MKKILLILPYFGNLNAAGFFPLFLQSCKKNETINFLLLTDDKTEYDYPTNVQVVMTTFQEIRERFQRHFSFSISLEKPYKLCDFRFAYHAVFLDEIAGYDAWGFCDQDLVFGDLRKYLTEERLERYGRVYTRGHLGVFRADIPLDFYQHPLPGKPDYTQILSSAESYSFDEWINRNPDWDALQFYGYESYAGMDNFDISPPTRVCPGAFRRARSSRNPDITERERHIHQNMLYYADGKLYRIGIKNGNQLMKEEIVYAHFQKRKMKLRVTDLDGSIIATPNYFANAPEPKNAMDVLKYHLDVTRADYLAEAICRKFHCKK